MQDRLYHPKYWLTWVGIGIWWLLVQLLPWQLMLLVSRLLALIALNINFSRRRIATRNIDCCFTDYSEQQKKAMLLNHLQMVIMGFFEVGMAWWWPRWRFVNIIEVEGIANLEKHRGKPVLVLAGHFTHLELGASALSLYYDGAGMYQKNNNAVLQWIQVKGRSKYCYANSLKTDRGNYLFEKHDLKQIVRYLKEGRALWYAPDQDMGAERSVFVPFMGQIAATVIATSKIARIVDATIVPMTQYRTVRGYKVIIYPALENFPKDSDEAAALMVNKTIESFVKLQPEAYFWVHRRFKTQADGTLFYKK